METKERIRPFVYGLALYFVMTPLDCISLGSLGSVIKIIVFIPVALMIFEIKDFKFRITPFVVIEILFCALTLLSVLYSVDQSKSANSVSTLVLNMVLVLLFGTVLVYRKSEIYFLKKSLILGSWLTIALLLMFSHIDADGRMILIISGDTQDPNFINGFFLIGFCYYCYEGLCNKKKIHFALAIVMLTVVLLTGSRGALVAFFACIMIYILILLFKSNHIGRNIFILIVACVVMAVAFNWVLAQMPENLAQRFSFDYIAEHGTTGRTRIWKYFINLFIEENPFRMLFGNGYGTSTVLNEMNHFVAHNLYLDNLITIGTLGLVLQLAGQAVVLYMLYKNEEWVLLGSFVGMIAMCMSLSLVVYRPIWNVMIMASAINIMNINSKSNKILK